MPMLKTIAFAVVSLGFHPRIAPENADNSAARLHRILTIIAGSRFGIHDLSRCRIQPGQTFARSNMPFELGLDHACQQFGNDQQRRKAILVLEQERYDYQKSLSDISGWDIRAHGDDRRAAVAAVRSWLRALAGAPDIAPTRILDKFEDFNGWYWERAKQGGASEADILAYPTEEMISAMLEWRDLGEPLTAS